MRLPVTVVIPLRDEEKSVKALLNALQEQSFSPEEILCVDGGSTDGTRELIQSREWGPIPVRLIPAGSSLPGRGRNIGTRQARNEWVAYIDGGIVPRSNWLFELVAKLNEDPEAEIVFGNFTPRMDSFFTQCAAAAYVKPLRPEQGHGFRGPSIPSSLLRRSLWERVGGFPENLRSGEDLVFIDRVMSSARYAFAPKASVTWELAPSLMKTFRRFRAYSKSGIEAGTFRDWHLRVLSRYAVIGSSAVVALAFGYRYWLVVPLALIASFLLLRGAVSVFRHRDELACSSFGLGLRGLGATAIIAAVDLGLWAGTIDWLWSRGAISPDEDDVRARTP